MNRETSVYLDAVRFSAALVVFLGHVGSRGLGDSVFWQLTDYGAPAVVIFFVLSGFVIGYVSDRRETAAREYAISRAARLYSVAIPALVATAALDWIGSRAAPDLYASYEPLLGPGAWHFLVCIPFMNELWGLRAFPGSDGPYWSLGYEAIYYVLFGIGFYGRGRGRFIACAALAIAAGPRIIAFFPLWGLGLVTYRVCKGGRLSPRTGCAAFLGSIAAAIGFVTWARRYGIFAGFHGMLEHDAWDISQEYVVALIFAGNLVGIHAMAPWLSSSAHHIARPVRWLAGATFTLYLLHAPLLVFVRALLPLPHDSVFYHAAIIGIPFVTILAVAQITERGKDALRALFDQLLPAKAAAVTASG